jgi:hypothetical protein
VEVCFWCHNNINSDHSKIQQCMFGCSFGVAKGALNSPEQ